MTFTSSFKCFALLAILIAPVIVFSFETNPIPQHPFEDFHLTNNKDNKLTTVTYVPATLYSPHGSAPIFRSGATCGYETLASCTYGAHDSTRGVYGGENICTLNGATSLGVVFYESGNSYHNDFTEYSDTDCSAVSNVYPRFSPKLGYYTAQDIGISSMTTFSSLTSSTVTGQRLRLVLYLDSSCTQGTTAYFAATDVCISGNAAQPFYADTTSYDPANSYIFNTDGSKWEYIPRK